MIGIARIGARLFRPAVAATTVAAAVTVALLIAGSTVGAVTALAICFVCALPLAARAFASPRPGLAWSGSAAEPWRSDRSPGEWSEVDAGRTTDDNSRADR